jgi:hypothetical protein
MRHVTLSVILLVAACAGNQEPQRACTLIGCNDGLNVTVTSAVQQDYSVLRRCTPSHVGRGSRAWPSSRIRRPPM